MSLMAAAIDNKKWWFMVAEAVTVAAAMATEVAARV